MSLQTSNDSWWVWKLCIRRSSTVEISTFKYIQHIDTRVCETPLIYEFVAPHFLIAVVSISILTLLSHRIRIWHRMRARKSIILLVAYMDVAIRKSTLFFVSTSLSSHTLKSHRRAEDVHVQNTFTIREKKSARCRWDDECHYILTQNII